MKKVMGFALIAMATMTTKMATAQQKVCRGQSPIVIAKGDFNSSVTNRTTQYNFKSGNPPTFPLLVTKLDTVNGASGVDSFEIQLVGDYSSVTFQWNLTKIGGRVDSFTVSYMASIDGVNYVTLSSTTAANSTGTRAYHYVVNSGVGNVFTHYKLRAACTNAASSSSGSWKGFVLVR
jgi:hypothetical protein